MGEILRKRLKQSRFKDPGQEALVNVMVAANYLRARLDESVAEFGLTAPQYNVLRILRAVYPEGHPRYEIASRMIENSPDVTRLVDTLIARGLVERFRSPEDGRRSIARITPEGLDLIEKAAANVKQFNKTFSSVLTEEEAEQLSILCEKVYGRGD